MKNQLSKADFSPLILTLNYFLLRAGEMAVPQCIKLLLQAQEPMNSKLQYHEFVSLAHTKRWRRIPGDVPASLVYTVATRGL